VRPDVYETLGAAQSAVGLHAAAAELSPPLIFYQPWD
jgi:hypothetical protein